MVNDADYLRKCSEAEALRDDLADQAKEIDKLMEEIETLLEENDLLNSLSDQYRQWWLIERARRKAQSAFMPEDY